MMNTDDDNTAAITSTTNDFQPDPLLMDEIRPGFWIGNLQSLKELSKAQNVNWTVVSVLKSEKLLQFARIALKGQSNIICHYEWELQDDSKAEFISLQLEEALQVIDKGMVKGEGGSLNHVLVHCAFGISRSAAVCAAWLISRQHKTLQQSLDEIRHSRPSVSPNIGFIAGLRALQESNGNIMAAIERLQQKESIIK